MCFVRCAVCVISDADSSHGCQSIASHWPQFHHHHPHRSLGADGWKQSVHDPDAVVVARSSLSLRHYSPLRWQGGIAGAPSCQPSRSIRTHAHAIPDAASQVPPSSKRIHERPAAADSVVLSATQSMEQQQLDDAADASDSPGDATGARHLWQLLAPSECPWSGDDGISSANCASKNTESHGQGSQPVMCRLECSRRIN